MLTCSEQYNQSSSSQIVLHKTHICVLLNLGIGVYGTILEGVTTSVVKLPLEPGKSYELYVVAVDNVGNSQSLVDVDSTKLVVPNGIYLQCFIYLFIYLHCYSVLRYSREQCVIFVSSSFVCIENLSPPSPMDEVFSYFQFGFELFHETVTMLANLFQRHFSTSKFGI